MSNKKPNVRVVYKPVIRKDGRPARDNAQGESAAGSNAQGGSVAALFRKAADKPESPYLRAANEDDDGYDPYSDRREELPLFEENPWD